MAHSNNGSIDKTDETATFSFTSIYESQIFDFGDATITKQLKTLTIYTSPLNTGQVATLRYSIDGGINWITVGSISGSGAGAGAVTRDFYRSEAADADFLTFKEIVVRAQSSGGAEITGIKLVAVPLVGSN